MSVEINRVPVEGLDRLNPTAFDQRPAILSVFNQLKEEKTVLHCGVDQNNEPRSASILLVHPERIFLSVTNFEYFDGSQVYFTFEFQSRSYFFSTVILEHDASAVAIAVPSRVYLSERRDRYRNEFEGSASESFWVALKCNDGTQSAGIIANWSETGIGVDVPEECCDKLDNRFELRFLAGEKLGNSSLAKIQHVSRCGYRKPGWVRLGLSIDNEAKPRLIEVDRRDSIIAENPERSPSVKFNSLRLRRAGDRSPDPDVSPRENLNSDSVCVRTFRNDKDEEIVSIVDSWGESKGGTAVVIPPAWGRTKETLMPLALTIVESFQRAGKPIVVLRFDGTNRKGESYINPRFNRPGDEYLGFTFSQAARDISAAIDFIRESEEFKPAKIVLVTFSLAAIEARHALALDDAKRVSGWVSTVGMTDLQSALRTISGGVDYAYGLLSGVRFGRHRLVGVTADMDSTGLDAIANRMVFLEDARQEMKAIDVPVTWIHGRDDAWIDIARARDILSYGNSGMRKLIEVPTGHQLRTSRAAMQTFQLITEEISEIALGQRIRAYAPNRVQIARKSALERNRRPKREVDLRDFWRDYLLGRDRKIGIELLTVTEAYRSMMRSQIKALDLKKGNLIADLGAGIGSFRMRLNHDLPSLMNVTVCELDFVTEALKRIAKSDFQATSKNRVRGIRAVSDLGLSRSPYFALKPASFDAALGSLLVGYLSQPLDFMREVNRILRPGGRLVLSALKRDADISKLFVDGVKELRGSSYIYEYTNGSVSEENRLFQDFLNDVSQILNLEEEGHFRFWDSGEFADLIRAAGFVDVEVWEELGTPPQAIVASAKSQART